MKKFTLVWLGILFLGNVSALAEDSVPSFYRFGMEELEQGDWSALDQIREDLEKVVEWAKTPPAVSHDGIRILRVRAQVVVDHILANFDSGSEDTRFLEFYLEVLSEIIHTVLRLDSNLSILENFGSEINRMKTALENDEIPADLLSDALFSPLAHSIVSSRRFEELLSLGPEGIQKLFEMTRDGEYPDSIEAGKVLMGYLLSRRGSHVVQKDGRVLQNSWSTLFATLQTIVHFDCKAILEGSSTPHQSVGGIVRQGR